MSRNVKNTRKKGDSWRKGRPKKNTKEGGKEDSNTDGQRSKAKKKTSLKGGNRPQNMCSGNGSKAGSIVKGQRRKRSKQETSGVNPNRKRKRMKTELADNNKSNDAVHGAPAQIETRNGGENAQHFRALQDNAAKFVHNRALTQTRMATIREAGAFRAPTGNTVV